MQGWKEAIYDKIAEHGKTLTDIQQNLPNYRGLMAFNMEDDRAFKPLEKGANAESWRSTLVAMQLALKHTRKDSHLDFLATKELVNEIVPAYMDLKAAYEIQGLVLLTICDTLGIDFDKVISKHVKKGGGDINEQREQNTQDTPFSQTETVEKQYIDDEDNDYNPFVE